MSYIHRFVIVFAAAAILSSCASPTDGRFVRQAIPIEIQAGRFVGVDLSLTGLNEVGIRCSPEAWSDLTNGSKSITIRLISSNRNGTTVSAIAPGSSRQIWPITSYHYLCCVSGEYHAKARVEIEFPNAAPGVTRAEIVVCKTPADFGL